MAIAIVAAIARTTMRITTFHRLNYDDMILIVSTLFLIAATVVEYEVRDLSYYQMTISLGFFREPPANFGQAMVNYEVLDQVASITTWGCIFSVKFAFVLFFKQLVERVRGLQRWWWCVFVTLCIAMPLNMFGGFIICANFTESLLGTADPWVSTASSLTGTCRNLYSSRHDRPRAGLRLSCRHAGRADRLVEYECLS